MTIAWKKCSEQMPPDDYTRIILRKHGNKSHMHTFGNIAVMESTTLLDMEIEWTEFTEEAWKELNKP